MASTQACRSRKMQAERPPAVKLEFQQVVAAVASLYDDQLQPLGRILLKRVGELAAAGAQDGSPAPFVDARRLRRLCEGCPRLIVEEQAGGEYVALLKGRRSALFVDPTGAEDPYPEHMWAWLGQYFSLEGEGGRLPLPGGRYACARALMARELPCLDGRSLGEVCHVVEIAVAQRRILGYSEGRIVSYGRSEASVKEMCAALQQPICSGKGGAPLAVATWADTRECLRKLLERAELRGKAPLVPVPNVKRLFRSQFQLQLSETALGHSRLQDLLNDPQLRDVCELRQVDGMHFVAEASGAAPQDEQDLRLAAAPVGCFPTQPCTSRIQGSGEMDWQGQMGAPLAGHPCALTGCFMGPAMPLAQGMYALPCDQFALDCWGAGLMQQQQWAPAALAPANAGGGAQPGPVVPPSPASTAPSKCPTESTRVSRSPSAEAPSGASSDDEAPSEGSRSRSPSADRRVEHEGGERAPSRRTSSSSLRESFWELMAQEDFVGRQASVVKNTFIHIAPDAHDSIDAGDVFVAKRRRHRSVPGAARLNCGSRKTAA